VRLPTDWLRQDFPKDFCDEPGRRRYWGSLTVWRNGTIDESVDFGQPQLLVQNLAMPTDIAVSDDIIYAAISGHGIISAFSGGNVCDESPRIFGTRR